MTLPRRTFLLLWSPFVFVESAEIVVLVVLRLFTKSSAMLAEADAKRVKARRVTFIVVF